MGYSWHKLWGLGTIQGHVGISHDVPGIDDNLNLGSAGCKVHVSTGTSWLFP